MTKTERPQTTWTVSNGGRSALHDSGRIAYTTIGGVEWSAEYSAPQGSLPGCWILSVPGESVPRVFDNLRVMKQWVAEQAR